MIVKSARFSEFRKYRYLLNRIWSRKKPIVFFVLLNPSTADENYNDPTVIRCMKFAESWGYGGIIVGNLFAFRATDPDDMKKALDPIGEFNDMYLEKWSHFHSQLTLIGWGNHGNYLDRDKQVLKLLKDPHCLKVTKQNQPQHPLFLKGSLKPVRF